MTLRTSMTLRLIFLGTLGVLTMFALATRAFGQSADASPAPNPNALTPPKLVTPVEAAYPAAAKAAGKEAVVELQVTLDAAGKPTDVQVVTPAGDGFDEAA